MVDVDHINVEYRLCRLCLFSTSCLKDIFKNNTEAEIDICETIEDLLRIEVVREDRFPWFVCSSCLDKLSEFRLFKQRCVECKMVFESRYKGKEYKMDNVASSYWKRITMPSICEDNVEEPGDSVDKHACENPNGKESVDILPDNFAVNSTLITTDEVIKNEEIEDNGGFSDVAPYVGVHVEVSCEIKSETSGVEDDDADIVDGSLIQTQLASTEDHPESVTSERTVISFPEEGNKVIFVDNHGSSTSTKHLNPENLEPRNIAAPTSDPLGMIKVGKSSLGRHSPEFHSQGKPSTNNPKQGRECKKREDLEPKEDIDKTGSMEGNNEESQKSKPKEVFRCGLCGVKLCSLFKYKVHVQRHGGIKPFGCDECGKTFSDKLSIAYHLRSHMDKECDICYKKFKDPSNLRRHLKTHFTSEGGYFECKICPEKFTSIFGLRNHSAVHEDRTPLSCTVCGLEFTHKDLLSKHLAIHSEGKPYDCKICGKKFRSRINLKKHSVVHSGENAFQCAICEKRFLHKWNLKHHIYTHDAMRECRTCGEIFPNQRALDIHETSHTGKIPMKCDVCGQEYLRKDHLARHMLFHSKGDTFECKECGLKYKYLSKLLNHVNNHHRDNKYSCDICGMKFHQRWLLVRHFVKHTMRYRCETCGDLFPRRPAYEQHVKLHQMDQLGTAENISSATSVAINPGIDSTPDSISSAGNTAQYPVSSHLKGKYVRKPVMCEICGQRFNAPSSLKDHLNIHMGIKPHSCETCGKSFTQKATLSRHVRTHTRIARYICEHCGRGFLEKREFITHMRIHTGDRPYICKFCGIGYRDRSHLSRHEKGHTAVDKPLECEVCKSRFSNAAGLASHFKIHTKGAVDLSSKKDTTQNDKPVPCQLCDRRFRSKAGLTLHLKVHARNGVVAAVDREDSLENAEVFQEVIIVDAPQSFVSSNFPSIFE